jgi:zinc protease
MAVIVVGDVDPAAVERQIADEFSAMAPRSPQAPAVDLGAVPDFKGVKTLYHSEPQAQATDVVIACTVPYAHQPDTAAYRAGLLPRALAIRMLNRRLSALSKNEKAPFIRAGSNVQEAYNLFRQASVDVVCRPGQWTAALSVADQELRRALVEGFRPDELRDAAADLRNDLAQAAQAAPGRRSGELANEIAESLVGQRVFTNPADDLAMYGAALAGITPADCAAALRTAWRSPGRYVFVAGNAVIGGDANASIASAYTNTLGVGVTQGAHPVSDWAYADFGAPGKVASRKYVDDLDFTEIAFANGVRLNLKRTDFESNTVRVAARLGAGQLTEPAATEPGLSAFAGLTFTAGGLGRHSSADLRRILAGRKVGVRFSSTLDAFTLTGDTDREDLALEFQLLAAYLSDPGYRPDTVVDARKRIDVDYVKFSHTVRGPLALQVPKLLFSDDPRFGLPPRDVMMARSLDEVKAWLAPTLSSGALEVSVAGDFGIEDAIEDAAKTIGTLPKRDPRPPLDDQRRVSFPSEPFAKDIPVDTADTKSLVAAYWPTSDGMDVHRARRLGVLASVLSERLREKVRGQLGNAYTPSVASSASDVFPGFGYIVAILEVDAAKAAGIEKLMVAVAGDLAARGLHDEEIVRIKDQLVTSALETERTNKYWMTVLGRAQEKPEVLDWARTRRSDIESITKADIDSLAKSYLAPERASRVIVHPAIAAPGKTTTVVPPPDAM